MVCSRCKMLVRTGIEQLGMQLLSVELGEIELTEEPTQKQLIELDKYLIPLGFERIDDRKSRIIEKIKNIVVELVHYSPEQSKIKLSEYLSKQLNYDYSHLSNLFSEVEGTTIEQYVILQKIERIKELLVYDELSLSQIAFQMGYSSVAYLSNQFKKVTGLTPSYFKQVKNKKRTPIEDL